MIIQYEHHGATVNVKKKLKGRHKNSCLCFANCRFFRPDSGSFNCQIAQQVYELCVKESLVLPVWECPQYEAQK